MEPHRIGLAHVEGVVGAEAEAVLAVGGDEEIELGAVVDQGVEPEAAEVGRGRLMQVLAAVLPRPGGVIHAAEIGRQVAAPVGDADL